MIPIALKEGHHRPTSETPLKWRFAGGPMVYPTFIAGLVALWFYRGSVPVLLRTYIFVFFHRGGGGPDPLSPSGSAYDRGKIQSTHPALVIYHKTNLYKWAMA